MIKDRFKHFYKTYFYFSSRERKGALGFILIMICVALSPSVYRLFFPSEPPVIKIHQSENFAEFSETSIPNEKQPKEGTGNKDELDRELLIDPNTASDSEWRKLGLKQWQIKNIRKYQAKGGHFKTQNDVAKIYGLSNTDFQKMKPHLKLNPIDSKKDTLYATPKRETKVVELNTADTNQLKSLYGIGSKMANKIVDYREKLGGYVSLFQLTEIWGFNEDLLYDLKGKLVLDTFHIRKIFINTISQESLSNHPYIKIRLSKIIINYRQQHGPYRNAEDLRKTLVVQDSTIKKVAPYLDFTF